MNEDKKKEKHESSAPDPVTSTFYDYKAEFRRIVWPSNQVLIKHTITVIVVSLLFGAYIATLDGVFSFGLRNFILFFLG
ncbi:MAG: preprotein translocase subunit SecE [Defluviitaleaceae bacterium]|nr:preprotein translocase subunit SecE [Defluviitaleaceae bacterium]